MEGDLVLLHELAQGPADKSYGLAVARLAGVPEAVVKRACSTSWKRAAPPPGPCRRAGDLPLFAAAIEAAEDKVDALRESSTRWTSTRCPPRRARPAL
jgi:DNA mismatch repair protein MutS